MDDFQRSLAKVLVHEGGYVNDPQDPGGATNQGVTQAVYDDYRQHMNLPKQAMKLLNNAERDSIYRMRYWALIKGDQLPAGVSYVVFDGAVNSGVAQSIKWLQRAVGVAADGVIGTATMNAVRAYGNNDQLVAKIIALREAFLRALKTFKRFGKGWLRRTAEVKAIGQAWATGDVGPDPTPATGKEKAVIADAKTPPPKSLGDAAGSAGTAGAVITQSIDQLKPLQDNAAIAKIIAVLTVAGVAIAIGGFAYSWWARRKAAQLAEALGTANA